jgi:hypothetical protein
VSYQKKAEQSPSSGSSLYRALLTAAAAAGIAFGFGGSSAPAQTPNTPKQPYSTRAAHKPTLATLVSQQDAPLPPQDAQAPGQGPKAEPPQEPQKQEPPKQEPYAKTQQELDLEHKAYAAYKSGRDAKPEGQLKHFVESLRLYQQAEAIAPPATYADELATVKDWVSIAYFKNDGARVKNLTPEQTKELDNYIANYGKEAPKPEPKPDVQPKQDVPPQPADPQPAPTQDKVPAEPKKSSPERSTWCYQCQEIEGTGPSADNRLSFWGEAGPDARGLGSYLRLGPLEALAVFERNAESNDPADIENKRYGIYTGANLQDFLGLHLKAYASASVTEDLLKSSSSDVTEDANFRITTRTDTEQLTTRTHMALGGDIGIGDLEIRALLYKLDEEIDVDVLTLLEVINKNDPAGNYNDAIPTSQRFLNETLGFQFGLGTRFDKENSAGILFTGEMTDMPDFGRDVDLWRAHLWYHHLSEDRKRGFHLIAGQGLLNDNGERFTRGEYGAAVAAELSDIVRASARFSRIEHPEGMLTLYLGRLPDSVPYILKQEIREVEAALNLDKRMDKALLRDYNNVHHANFIHWLAQNGNFALIPGAGAARIEEAGRQRTVYNWDATAILPLFNHVTFAARGYEREDEFAKTQGVQIMVIPRSNNKDEKNYIFSVAGEKVETPAGEKETRILGIFDIIRF